MYGFRFKKSIPLQQVGSCPKKNSSLSRHLFLPLQFPGSQSTSARPEGDTFKGHLDSEFALLSSSVLLCSVLGHWGHLLLQCLSSPSLSLVSSFHSSPSRSCCKSKSPRSLGHQAQMTREGRGGRGGTQSRRRERSSSLSVQEEY